VCSPFLRPGNVAAFAIEERDEERLAIIAEVERRFRTKDIEETARSFASKLLKSTISKQMRLAS